MLGNVKIGTKLISGFLIVAGISAAIGMFGISNMNKINLMLNTLYDKHLMGISEVKEANINLIYLGRAARQLVLAKDQTERNTQMDNINKYGVQVSDLMSQARERFTTEEGKAKYEQSMQAYNEYFANVKKFSEMVMRTELLKLDQSVVTGLSELISIGNRADQLMTEAAQMKVSQGQAMHKDSDVIYENMKNLLVILIILGTLIGLVLGFFLSSSISKPLSEVVKMIQEIAKGELGRKLSMDRKDEIGILGGEMDSLVNTMKDLIIDDGGMVLESASNKDLTKRLQKNYSGQFGKMKDNINRVVMSLDQAMQQVADATDQVSSASQQISAGSQSLAQGANQQASSLEEISSSLEEMASMTKQNADNALQAKNLAGEADGNAKTGSEAMIRMSGAINRIKESSDQTAKIVKTIDEIAMQTNLLALNAAVEAARAGEAGRGFAVVAEEVRNLAQRSAQAAKNTADMISESVKNADDGVKIATEVAQSFEVIAGSAKKVNDLITEIASASQEQSQGIDQISTAVTQMDKITQQNAANSEESASAAEELSSQAEELQGMVGQFSVSADVNNGARTVVQVSHGKHLSNQVQINRKGQNSDNSKNKVKKNLKKSETSYADEVSPVDDEILKEF